MNLPLQITLRHMEASPALETRIRTLASRLDRFSTHITLSIHRAHPRDHAHEDPYVALRDAFRAARRKLQDYERKHRRDVKTHAALPHGRICELDGDRGFGRIESDDGRLIYFHRNSVLGLSFDALTTGAEVSFAEETGARGPQASAVHVL